MKVTKELHELTQYVADGTHIVQHYLDFNYNDRKNAMGLVPMRVETDLKQLKRGVELKNEVAQFLFLNVTDNTEFPQIDKNGLTDDELKAKVKHKVEAHSRFIQTDGRIGEANTIVVNSKMVEFGYDFGERDVVINDFIPNDTVYMLNNTDMSTPGFKFAYYRDTAQQELYYAIVRVGHNAQRQASKFTI